MAALKKISQSKATTKAKAKAKKPVTKVAKPKNESKGNVVTPFIFRSVENKWLGDEPVWENQPSESDRFSKMARSFSWYNYYFQNKEAKPMLLQWLEIAERKDEAKALKSVHESEYSLTSCWLARMASLGLVLTEQELKKVECEVERLKNFNPAKEEAKSTEKKPTIQDHLRNKALDIAGELEGVYDEWVKGGAKGTPAIAPIDTMKSMNLAPNQVGLIQDVWLKELTELQAAQKDKDVAECYDSYSKIQIRNMIKYIEQVLADCASYVQVKKVERKPRAKKAKSPEQLTRTFKYAKEFEELKLKSESPAKLVAAQEAWLYDTLKRKLIHVVADSNAGSLTVKGTAIIGFSDSDTVMKTLRKPKEQIKELLSGGKPVARKYFKDIKSTEVKWKGRSNENIIILKVW